MLSNVNSISTACGRKMTDEKIISFKANQVILGDRDIIKSRVLFLTKSGIIVASFDGIDNWTIAFVIFFFAIGLIGLFLRNLMLSLAGLVAGTVAGITIGLFDFTLRRRRLNSIKRLDPNHVLELSRENFEIAYTRIDKVEVGTLSTYPGANYLFPSFQENQYKIDFIAKEEKYTFALDRSRLQLCLEMLRKFAPITMEIEGTLLDE